jgi:hypothetical protein
MSGSFYFTLVTIKNFCFEILFFFFRLPVGEEVRALQPLREFEILLIICAIVFLALLLVSLRK